MLNSDNKVFFAKLSELDKDLYIFADYYLETLEDPETTAAHLCQEMSTVQWHRVGVDEDFRPKFGAKVIEIRDIHKLENPSSPHLARQMGWEKKVVNSCRVKIAYPFNNFGTRIPNLLTVFCGEGVFHAPHICAIRLEDIYFPDSFLSDFQGPQFGIPGLREILSVHNRPFFFGVIKPNIGLPIKPYGEIAYKAWCGGLDVAMDDELIADASWSPLGKRSKILGHYLRKAESETGSRKIYQANITDEIDRLIPNHDTAVKNGANALMLNSMTVGLSACRMLRKLSKVPLVSHFDLYGAMTQIPFQGIREKVFIKLQRLSGFDAILFPGFDIRMKSTREDVLENVRACLEPMGSLKPSLPIPAGSQWAGSLGPLYQELGTIDFAIVPGRGVFDHPMGPEGGAKSLHQGWNAVKNGIPFNKVVNDNQELKLAIQSRK